jgi:hypothetical protein
MVASLALALLLPAHAAVAQSPLAAGRVDIAIDVGAHAAPKAWSDTFEVPLYQESKRITTEYPARGGTFTSAAGHYRIWRQLTVGAGFSHFAGSGDAQITASVPHPFFDHQPRTVMGTASTRREEGVFYGTVGVRLSLSRAIYVSLDAGPAALNVHQSLVSEVTVTQTYPYDTAAFAKATVRDSARTAAGIYAGGGVTWMFSRHLGAGGVIQFTHARVKESVDNRTVSIDAGGVQGGGGLRLLF